MHRKTVFFLILFSFLFTLCKKKHDNPVYRGYIFSESPIQEENSENIDPRSDSRFSNCSSKALNAVNGSAVVVCRYNFNLKTEVALHFTNFSTRAGKDIVFLQDEDNAIKTMYHGKLGDFWTEPVVVKSLTLRFILESGQKNFSFEVDRIHFRSLVPEKEFPRIPLKELEVSYESDHDFEFSELKGKKSETRISEPGADEIQIHFSLLSINSSCGLIVEDEPCPSNIRILNSKRETIFNFSARTYFKNNWLQIPGDLVYIVYEIKPFKPPKLNTPVEADYGFKIDKLRVRSKFPVFRYALKYPIVFAHGLFGFNNLYGVDYFFRVRKHLEDQGYEVYMTEVPPVSSLQTRADFLAEQINDILKISSQKNGRKIDKIHFIAHSMGGLDGRVLISKNTEGRTKNPDKRFVIYGRNMGKKFASFITIGTPHKGTIIADIVQGFIPEYNLKRASITAIQVLTKLYNYPNPDEKEIVTTSFELTEMFCKQFNIDHPEPTDLGIHYMTFAGITKGPNEQTADSDEVNILLLPTYYLITKHPDPDMRENDGVVSFESAKWKEKYYTLYHGKPLHIDHLDEIGQLMGHTNPNFNHLEFYDFIAKKLEPERN